MEVALFWLGSIMAHIGGTLLYSAVKSRSSAFGRNGQVVGFATGPLGSKAPTNGISQDYRTIIRFVGIDGQDHFLMESMGSPSPSYFMGEFVPLLLSRDDKKRVFFQTHGEQKSGVIWLLVGIVFLLGYFVQRQGDIVPTLFLAAVVLAMVSVAAAVARKFGHDWRRLINGGKNLGSLVPPIVLPIEESRNIPWAQPERVKTPKPKIIKAKNPWFLQKLFLLLMMTSFSLAGFFVYQTHQFIKNSSPARGMIADVKVKTVYKELKLFVPVVRYYGNKKNIIEFQDPIGTPLQIFERGQDTKIIFDRRNPHRARVDLGDWNYWVGYLFFAMGVLFLYGYRTAVLHAQKVRTQKITPINVRKVS